MRVSYIINCSAEKHKGVEEMLSITEVEEVRDKVKECAELTDGVSMLVQETGCGGESALFNIAKQLYNLSTELTERMNKGEQ